MSNLKFDDLPYEIQYQIIINLYPSWWLIAEEINAYNATAICKITSSRRLQSSPLFVCRSMHKAASLALSSQFTRTLYAAPMRTTYSIIPKFKIYLAKVTKVVMDQSQPLLEMSQLYAQRLPALRTIEVISYVTYPIMKTIAEKYTLEQVLHSDSADADLARMICTPEVRRTKIIREASSLNPGLQYLYQQGFPLHPADTIVVSSSKQ